MKKQWVLAGILASALGVSDALAQHQTPNQQPNTATAPAVPAGDLALGKVKLPRAVTADGKALPAGTYDVKLTAQAAKPMAVGTTEPLERWVEFAQGGTVKGREVVSIVPQGEIKMVVKDAPPATGASKVQVLRGNEYLRVWINKAGNHYLIHLPAAGGANGQ
ncbi:MAG: hypothetical protein ABIX28_08770 [Vicinamibacterales bacterium]